MIYFLCILTIVFFLTTLFLGFYCYKFGKMILNIQDELESSIGLLEERTQSIARILEVPLFYDSPEIRRVHEDIKESKEALIQIAKTFSKIQENQEEEDGGS